MRKRLWPCLLIQLSVASSAWGAADTPMQEAQAAMPTFLHLADSRPSWARHLRVKITLREGNDAESFWLDAFRAGGGGYQAQLVTRPQRITTVHAGDQLPVKPSAIEDWTYDDDRTGLTHGHFAICAELAALSAEEATEQRAYWRLACKP